MKAVDMMSMARVSSIYRRNEAPTRQVVQAVPTRKQGNVELSTTRSATQAASVVIVILAAATSTFSSQPMAGAPLAATEAQSAPRTLHLENLSLGEFVERYLALRDDLAYRALTGDLPAEEAAHLQALNAALSQLLPRPSPPPVDVVNAMAEVRRLLGA
jgi:hypothetical protein